MAKFPGLKAWEFLVLLEAKGKVRLRPSGDRDTRIMEFDDPADAKKLDELCEESAASKTNNIDAGVKVLSNK